MTAERDHLRQRIELVDRMAQQLRGVTARLFGSAKPTAAWLAAALAKALALVSELDASDQSIRTHAENRLL